MANWCTNRLKVKASGRNSKKKLKNFLKALIDEKTGKIDLNNIIPMPEKFFNDSCYSNKRKWMYENWGSFSNANFTEYKFYKSGKQTELIIEFETIGTPAIYAIKKFVEDFKNEELELCFEYWIESTEHLQKVDLLNLKEETLY